MDGLERKVDGLERKGDGLDRRFDDNCMGLKEWSDPWMSTMDGMMDEIKVGRRVFSRLIVG